MVELHAAGGWIVLVAAALFTVAVAIHAVVTAPAPPGDPVRWIETSRIAITALLGAQAALGALLYALDRRPSEDIHLLYGLVALIALPGASAFASEAPRRARSVVLAIAGLLTFGIATRLLGTG